MIHLPTYSPMLLGASIGITLVTAVLFFMVFFKDFGDFWECVCFWFTPDVISLFRGELDEDRWASLKLIFWVGLSAAMGLSAYFQLPKYFPHLFQ